MQLLSTWVKFSSCTAGPILFFFSAAPLLAEDQAITASAKSLAAAETAFAQESAEKGMRNAFLQVLSDDSIVFLPGPQNGKKAWESKPASEAVLQWHPILAVTSTGGDLGYTTGPWSSKKNAADKEPTDFGHFVSIWRWEKGKWKLIFDLGSDHPRRPAGASPELQLMENHAPHESPVTALPSMLALDRSYASDRIQHFSSVAEDLIRVYPPQEFPLTGREAAAAALDHAPKSITFGEPKGEVSHGGDLGFAWGEYTAATPGDYLRIWRKDRAGNWKLALELLHHR
jgi:ketosteroid isomerase-like protein